MGSKALVPRGAATPAPLEKWEEEEMQRAQDARSKETLGIPRITHRGADFKLDEQVVGRTITLAVVAIKHEKSYFKGKFDPSKPATPDCYAFGDEEKSMVAHEQAPDKQNKQADGSSPCNGCKHNAFGTADVGRGKKCKDYRRLLVISPRTNKDTGEVSLTPDDVQRAEKRLLAVPPASLKNWANYLTALKDKTRTGSPSEMIMKVETYALPNGGHGLKFVPVQAVERETLKAIVAIRPASEGLLTQPYPVIAQDEEKAPVKGQEKPKKK